MNIRQLIKEEIARNIPYEPQVMLRRDTEHVSSFHAGSKPITAKELGVTQREFKMAPYRAPEKRFERPRTEREKEFEAFMEEEVGGRLVRTVVQEAPRLDILMCGAILQEIKVNRIFSDINGNFVIHAASIEGSQMGISAYSRPHANSNEKKVSTALEKLNETFGTAYFVDVSYSKNSEDVFVIKCGRENTSDGKPLTYGQFMDFSKIIAEQQAALKAMGAFDDKEPWRCITEFGKDK